jgi:polyphosphate glucokinase
MKILVIDVGGTHVKVLASGRKKKVEIPSGPHMTPAKMVAEVRAATDGWTYEAVSMGYPGPVVQGHPITEPYHLGRGWVRFNFKKAFHRRVKIVNDAAMQALGSYQGGQMLFLGLGTGLGSALIVDNVLAPVELAHLAYKKGRSYEDYVGAAADQASARRAPGTECTRIRRRISPVDKAVQWINSRAIRSSCEQKKTFTSQGDL